MTTAKEKVREKIELLEALKWWMDNAEHEPINSAYLLTTLLKALYYLVENN